MERPVKPVAGTMLFEDYMTKRREWEKEIEKYCDDLEFQIEKLKKEITFHKQAHVFMLKEIKKYKEKLRKLCYPFPINFMELFSEEGRMKRNSIQNGKRR